jgi:hypothetical protein
MPHRESIKFNHTSLITPIAIASIAEPPSFHIIMDHHGHTWDEIRKYLRLVKDKETRLRLQAECAAVLSCTFAQLHTCCSL